MKLRIHDMIQYLDQFAPPQIAQEWDNVGLLYGDAQWELQGAVVCLDITQKVYNACVDHRANLCVCHHPFIFDPIDRINLSNPHHLLLNQLMKADIAVFAAHTNLDACSGGVNDVLAQRLGLTQISPFTPESDGAVKKGSKQYGIGRIASNHSPEKLFHFCQHLKKVLNCPSLTVNFDQDKAFHRAFVIAGSYDSDWNTDVCESGAEVIITGEMKYNDMIFFHRYGISVICAGHDCTERIILGPLAERMRGRFPEIQFAVCEQLNYNKLGF